MNNKLMALRGFWSGGRARRVLPVMALLAGALFLAGCGGGVVAEEPAAEEGPPADEAPADSPAAPPPPPQIERVSLHSDGTEGDFFSERPTISADGRYVAFQSSATNLVAGDTNGLSDIFVRDTMTGATTRVSVDSAGAQASGVSFLASISADGRYVAFQSSATNLVAGDTNGLSDIFVRDTVGGTTIRVSVDSGGAQAIAGASSASSISADGRYVAFHSRATNLVASDVNGDFDVFVRDTMTGTTTRVSVDSADAQANGHSERPTISADGGYVAFQSDATNLVIDDTNFARDVFVHDTMTGVTTRVSVDSAGAQATGGILSRNAAISADGRHVAFESDATNLVAGDTNGNFDVFVRDTVAGTTTRVSVDSAGAEAAGSSFKPAINADGSYVAFQSNATNLVPGDTNAVTDVFRAPAP